ncbi:MAG: hypothetical protein WC481_08490 [Candidatus Omnitrophota bacterium]|jgi:hypothetical protein
MSDYLGVNATKAATPTSENILSPGLLGGKVRCMVDTYEAAAVAATKTIQMGQALPVGAKILGMKVAFDDLSAGGATIDIGDADDDDRYMSAVDVDTAASNSDAILVDGLGYTILGTGLISGGDDTKILILVNTAAITGTIKLVVFYTVE